MQTKFTEPEKTENSVLKEALESAIFPREETQLLTKNLVKPIHFLDF